MITNNLPHLATTTESRYLGLRIMCSDSNPCYLDVIEKTYRELTLMLARYTRVVVVRLDLKLAEGTYPSKVNISKFRKSFVRKLEREYNSKVAYLWVREFGKSDHNNGTHWHWWVAVKASTKHRPKFQAKDITSLIESAWTAHTGNDSKTNMAGFFFLERKFFSPEGRKQQQEIIANGPPEGKSDVLINRKIIANRATSDIVGGVIDECFFALSYMAKVYTKTRTKNTKGKPVFKSSNLNTKDIKKGRQEVIERNLSQIHVWLNESLESMPLAYTTKPRIKNIKSYQGNKSQNLSDTESTTRTTLSAMKKLNWDSRRSAGRSLALISGMHCSDDGEESP